jgi:inositol monophosphatase
MNFKYLLDKTVDVVLGVRDVLKNTENTKVREKSKGNYVTNLDIEVEDYLKNNLSLFVPKAGIISEESEPQIGEFNWVIDPIDGTGNYINGYPFAVSVAYVKNTNETIFGVVYDFNNDVVYYALNGHGSFIKYRNGEVKVLNTSDKVNDGITIFGMPYDRKKTHKILKIVEKLYEISSDIKRIGPSSLDICAVAEGRAQIYAELDLEQWDIQAGKLILE